MSKKGTKALASATIMSLVLTTALAAGPVKAAAAPATRIAGGDRYATAAQVATTNWTTSDSVVLVNGENYPDAVSASALAKKLNAPILLTRASELSADTSAAIAKLGAKNIYVVGGEASVSTAVRNTLKAKYTLTELSGANRYETNVAVAKELVKQGVKADNVLVVGGEGFSDALSVAPVAAAKGQILLLANNNDDSMKSVIDFVKANNSKVTVVGTANVISEAMRSALNDATRINGGADRFDTNLKVLDAFKADLKTDNLYVANASGNGFADALVASALAGKTAAPLVLVGGENENSTVNAIAYVKANGTDKTVLSVVGGTGVVSEATLNAISGTTTPIPTTIGEITSVEAVDGQVVNAKSNDEALKFTVNNGRATTVDEVLDAGYTIEFNADKSVFDGTATSKDGSLTKSDLKALLDDSTDHFKYQVVIKKDGVVVAQTANTRVDIISADTTANSIGDATIKLGDESEANGDDAVELTSHTLVKDEVATVTQVKGNTIDGKNNVTITNKKFYSSDDFIASVNETTGEITPHEKGNFNLIIKSGDIQKEISMTVSSDARKPSKATVSTTSIALGKPTTGGSTSTTFDLKLYDQFGDPMKGVSAADDTFTVTGDIKDGDNVIATTTLGDATDKKGKTVITVTTSADTNKSGNGTIKIKNEDGKQLAAISVKVGYAGTVDTYKIEAAGTDNDFTLDLNPEAADKDSNAKVEFKVNKYDKNGNFLGAVNGDTGVTVTLSEAKDKTILEGDTDSVDLAGYATAGKYKVNTLFDDVDANILNKTAAKTGTLTITVKDGDVVKATKTITVKNTSPVISGASFAQNLDVANGGTINLEDIIKADNINISGSAADGKVRITQDGQIFMNYDGGVAGGTKEVGSDSTDIEYTYGQDIYLGKIVFSNSDTVYADDFSGEDAAITFHNTGSTDKTITVGIVKAGDSTPSITTKVTVQSAE